MFFDTDGTALDVVQLADYKANATGKPYAIVIAPSGNLLAVPVEQCVLEIIEVIHPTNTEAKKDEC